MNQLTKTIHYISAWSKQLRFRHSAVYWEKRYRRGKTSGGGSYGENAQFKANFLNAFVAEHGVRRVIELGCGDGAQLSLASYPDYVGVDVAPTAVRKCRERFARTPNRRFFHSSDRAAWAGFAAELALSLDVVYHLVEDEVFEAYMRDLFDVAGRYVIIYSWNEETGPNYRDTGAVHMRRRRFTEWVRANADRWRLTEVAPNRNQLLPSFYVYARRES